MVSKSQRQRRRERERFERYEQRRREAADRSYRRRRTTLAVAGGLVLVLGLLGTVWWLSDPGTDEADVVADQTPAPGAEGECVYTPTGDAASNGEAGRDVGVPPAEPGALTPPVTATFTVNGQDVTAELAGESARCAVNSLRFLATEGFFDATACHRLTTSETLQVLQCGDPTGTGSGGPGYSFADESLEGATYTAGTIAMANSGPDTNGSQFFLVYGDSTLNPAYTVVGRITAGLEVIRGIAAGGSDESNGPGDGKPLLPATLDGVAVTAA